MNKQQKRWIADTVFWIGMGLLAYTGFVFLIDKIWWIIIGTLAMLGGAYWRLKL